MDDPFASFDCFLRTDPRDAGCTKTLDLLGLSTSSRNSGMPMRSAATHNSPLTW